MKVLKAAFSWPTLLWMSWRARWSIAGLMALGALIGTLTGILLPKEYAATALVLVDPQKVPDKFVSSSVSTDVQDRLATISQQILSNTKLQKVIDEFDLYAKERKKRYPEEILDLMRSNVAIRLEKGWTRDQPGAFHVSYRGSDPAVVAEVANRIVSLFLEENMREREASAEGTADFLEGQLQQSRRQLELQETKLAEYKLQHKGELPGQEQFLTGTLTRLQIELQGSQEAMARAAQNKITLESALEITQNSDALTAQMLDRSQGHPESVRKLSDKLAPELDAAKLRYTKNHPDVLALKRDLEWARENEAAETPAAPLPPKTDAKALAYASPQDFQMRLQMKERMESTKTQLRLANDEIAARGKERDALLAKIAANQERFEHLPVRELQMGSITRDYEISMASYRSLLDKKLSAQLSTEMERQQKGESFKILDPAVVPQKPLGMLLDVRVSIGSAAGLIVALLLALSLSVLRNRLLGEWEMPSHIPVLARIPVLIENRAAIGQQRTVGGRMRFALALSTPALVVVSTAVFFWMKRIH